MGGARDSRGDLVRTMAQLLREQGYAATSRAQVLSLSGVSNGSLYHHFPGGMEELAEAAIRASGAAVGDALTACLSGASDAAYGIRRFLDLAAGPADAVECLGCPVAPTALESPSLSPRLRVAAGQCFEQWEDIIAARLIDDGWPADDAREAASGALSLIEGALLLARVRGRRDSLEVAQRAVRRLIRVDPPAVARYR